jgi:outer membrane protein assembly factor BamE (lipoprotein component of BamABCDE complex)
MAASTQIRKRLGTARLSLCLLLTGVALAACQPQLEVRGDEPDPQALAQIEPGKSTKADVTNLLGSPSTVSTFNPDVWYYISTRDMRLSFFKPQMLDQRVYVVEFDDQGLVKDLQSHLNDQHEVAMIKRTTPAPGKELTLMEQLLGNFGRFSNTSSSGPAGSGNAGTGTGGGMP